MEKKTVFSEKYYVGTIKGDTDFRVLNKLITTLRN